MSATTRVHCKACGKHAEQVGAITWAGYCFACGKERRESNVLQMHARSGPNWKKWRRSMAACVGGVLLDDDRERA